MRKYMRIILCTLIAIVIGFILTVSVLFYLFYRVQTPPHLSVVPMSENKIINCFYEYEDEIVNITYQLQSRPEENLDWHYMFPDEVKDWDKSVWLPDKEGDFYKKLVVLKNEGFVKILKRKNFIMFERWSSATKTSGIIYSETDPREHFTSEYYRDLELKETDVENFYYYAYDYDWDL